MPYPESMISAWAATVLLAAPQTRTEPAMFVPISLYDASTGQYRSTALGWLGFWDGAIQWKTADGRTLYRGKCWTKNGSLHILLQERIGPGFPGRGDINDGPWEWITRGGKTVRLNHIDYQEGGLAKWWVPEAEWKRRAVRLRGKVHTTEQW